MLSRRQIRQMDRRGDSKRHKTWKSGSAASKGERCITIQNRRLHRDNKLMTLRDGRVIDYHPSYNFDRRLELPFFTQEQRDNMKQQREAWRRSRGPRSNNTGHGSVGNNRSMQEVVSAMNDAVSVLSRQIQSADRSVPGSIQMNDGGSTIGENTHGGGKTGHRSIMGGRNEQSRNA